MPQKLTLERFMLFLGDRLPGFNGFDHETRFNLCHTAYELSKKKRQHKAHPGYAMMTYQERNSLFKNLDFFRSMNAILGFFDIEHEYRWTEGDEDKPKWTKGIRLSSVVIGLIREFRASDPIESELIFANGERMGKPPKNGIHTDRKLYVKPKIRSDVPVNMVELRKLRDQFKDREDGKAIYDEICDVLHFSTTRPFKRGHILQRYYYADTGRLYADCPVPLQSIRNIVCDTALAGCWEYDFINCHYSIFNQLAGAAGVTLPSVNAYIENTEDVRATIEVDVGITKVQAKKCLLAVMYGAVESTWEKAAITKLIGRENAVVLFNHPLFSGILSDIKKGRRPIIDNCKSTQRAYVNAMGRPIPKRRPGNKRRTPDKFVLAHIMQGLEAQMLHIAICLYPDMRLLKHDGFTLADKVDTTELVKRVFEATGMKMSVKRKQHVSGVQQRVSEVNSAKIASHTSNQEALLADEFEAKNRVSA
jgi:hypothetical protein